MSLVAPGAALGDIYRWTDERGITVLSDVLPKPGDRVNNFEVIAKTTRLEANTPVQVATLTKQALHARVIVLEQQLQAQQPVAPAPVTYGGTYYPSAPPPWSYYENGYTPRYYSSYSYPVVATYPYAYPTTISRSVLVAPRRASVHVGGGHRGRR